MCALKIGGVDVENPIFLAPMAGVTVSAVRRLFRRMGVALTHSEMVSSTGLIFGGKKTLNITEYTDIEQPMVLQLFDGDVDRLCKSAELCLKAHSYAALGINMACPMPKILKRGAGSKLLQNPDVASKMVHELKRFGLPVWPKIRKVVPDGNIYPLSTLDITEKLIEAGADNVAIHGRTPAQRYEGIADKNEVLSVAQKFPSMVTATGDVFSADDVKFYLDGGCAAVLLARGAVANPFIAAQSLRSLGYNTTLVGDDMPIEKRAELLIDFANDIKNIHGENFALVLIRRFTPGFFKEKSGVGDFKRALAVVRDWETMYRLLLDWRSYFERGAI